MMNYKKLGDYIEEVNIRNRDLLVDTLLGVSIKKVFIPSIANTIGSDMSKYKIVEKNQFAYGPITSRNGDKISVALLKDYDKAIISQAYKVFKVAEKELLPDYLMMWMMRPEFDRYARFKSHGSTREAFDWEEMCEVELPIPTITEQQKIVNEYQVLSKRIALNEQINTKLEETAQALYKHWFVDFEFPNENGLPYKSSGGKMVFNEELEKEIPMGWEVNSVKNYCIDIKSGGTPSRTNIDYWNSNDFHWLKTGEIKNNVILETEEYISLMGLENSSAKLLPINTVLMSMYGVNAGEVGFLKIETTTNQACCGMICKNIQEASFLYYHLVVNQEFNHSQAIGGAQQNLSKDYIENIKILKADTLNISIFENFISNKEKYSKQIQTLKTMQELLLARMGGK